MQLSGRRRVCTLSSAQRLVFCCIVEDVEQYESLVAPRKGIQATAEVAVYPFPPDALRSTISQVGRCEFWKGGSCTALKCVSSFDDVNGRLQAGFKICNRLQTLVLKQKVECKNHQIFINLCIEVCAFQNAV